MAAELWRKGYRSRTNAKPTPDKKALVKEALKQVQGGKHYFSRTEITY